MCVFEISNFNFGARQRTRSDYALGRYPARRPCLACAGNTQSTQRQEPCPHGLYYAQNAISMYHTHKTATKHPATPRSPTLAMPNGLNRVCCCKITEGM